MSNMVTDIRGRVANTSLSTQNSLLPVFEAIVNSIQSIEDNKDENCGVIEIFAQRINSGQLTIDGKPYEEKFDSFTIIDNGLGFNENNFNSFMTSDSLYKIEKGCKGVGRFLWLKAFRKVSICSIYKENSKCYKRVFDFSTYGIEPEDNLEEIVNTSSKTSVTLHEYKNVYSSATSTSLQSLAEKIIEHLLTYFISNKCPKIILKDSLENEICLNDFFDEEIRSTLHQDVFSIKSQTFKLVHLKIPSATTSHKLHLCGDGREVKAIELRKYINNLQKKIRIGKNETAKEFWYTGYLTSAYLDSALNAERTIFSFPEENDMLESITEQDIINSSCKFIELYLKDELNEVNEKKRIEIDHFIDNRKPQYRALRKYKSDFYDTIPAGLPPDRIEIELHKSLLKWENEVNEQGIKLINNDQPIDDMIGFKKRYEQYCNEVTALGKTSLAEYIVRRKAILDLLQSAISINNKNGYNLESSIHSIICPMRITSDEVEYEEMNLWLIDEKLSYHYFLASDKPLKSLPVIDTDSQKELDLAVFNNAFSFVDNDKPYTSVSIIEFKKPMRNDYTEEKNPISQVYQYVDDIREGKALSAEGRPLGKESSLKSIPIYGYIISDITDKLKFYAKNASLQVTPDGEGYFGYNKERETYIEIISYDKLIGDAKKRNDILFNKLFSPEISHLKEFRDEEKKVVFAK